MTPPHAPLSGDTASEGQPAAVPVCVTTIRKRADFLRASRSGRCATPGFILQMRRRGPDEGIGIRYGVTCSRKVGNAVARNRAKRRLREIARLTLPECGLTGHDYVLIGRKDVTAARPFQDLLSDLERALRTLQANRP